MPTATVRNERHSLGTQLFSSGVGAVLSDKAQRDATEDHEQDDCGVDPIAQNRRGDCGNEQDEKDRADELAETGTSVFAWLRAWNR